MRKQEEFGWTLVSAQEGATLRGGQVKKLTKLLFTRTGTPEWIEDMNHLEEEFTEFHKGVRIGRDGLVLLGSAPRTRPQFPLLLVTLFAGYLVGWAILDITLGSIIGVLSVLVLWVVYQQRGAKRLAVHTAARRKATDEFRKKRNEILVRVRAHVNTRDSDLPPNPAP